MSKQESKMICPKCGDEMNHHADKLVYPGSAQGGRKDEPRTGRRHRGNPRLSGLRCCGVAQGGVILVCGAPRLISCLKRLPKLPARGALAANKTMRLRP